MEKYQWVGAIPQKGEKVLEMMETGVFFCPCYKLNGPSEVAHKIYNDDPLPNFTGITNEDKSHINRVRFNLYSLLLPIHDRETAMKEFLLVSKEWEKLTQYNYDQEFFQEFSTIFLASNIPCKAAVSVENRSIQYFVRMLGGESQFW